MAIHNRAFTILGILGAMAGSAHAQGGTIHIPTLVAGDTVTIEITGGSPGSAYDITITGDTGAQEHVTVTLDANGKGSFEWDVRGDWVAADFELPDGTGDARGIHQP